MTTRLCKGEDEARWRKIAESLVEYRQEPNLRDVLHAQLVQNGVFLEDNLQRGFNVPGILVPRYQASAAENGEMHKK